MDLLSGLRPLRPDNGLFPLLDTTLREVPSSGSPSTFEKTVIPLLSYSMLTEQERNLPMPKTQRLKKYLEVQYEVGDHAVIDGDIQAIVVAVTISGTGNSYKMSWWHNGQMNQDWFDEWRLTDDKDK
jgi:hypothetical protein